MVARIAQAAGCSGGAFYERFRNKDAFLDYLIRLRLRRGQERAVGVFDPARWKRTEPTRIARALVEHTVHTFHGHGAGVVKAALKRGHLDPEKMKPLMDYRIAVADRAERLLVPRASGVRNRGHAVRAMMQRSGR